MTYGFGDPVRTLVFDGSIGYGTSSTSESNATKKVVLPFPSDLAVGDIICVSYNGYGVSAGGNLTFEIGKSTVSYSSADGTWTSFDTPLTATSNVTFGTSSDRKGDVVELTVTQDLVDHFEDGNTSMLTWYRNGGSSYKYAYAVMIYLKKAVGR